MTGFNKKQILQKIRTDLFPIVSPPQLVLKITTLHLLVTLFVLAICPQFGFGLLKNGHYGLTSIFMMVSHEFCQLMCGLFLTISSSLTIWYNLKITEKEWLKQNTFVSISLLFAITSGFFWMSAPQIHIMDFMIWTAGSLIALSLPVYNEA